MQWSEKLSVDNELIDGQHQRLIEITNQVEKIFRVEEKTLLDYDEMVRILVKLNLYTLNHFGMEEKLLEKFNYPEEQLKKHKAEHQYFIDFLEDISVDKLNEKTDEVLLDIYAFLSNWILTHIRETDSKYKAFLKLHEQD
jgi:hemerythrin